MSKNTIYPDNCNRTLLKLEIEELKEYLYYLVQEDTNNVS